MTTKKTQARFRETKWFKLGAVASARAEIAYKQLKAGKEPDSAPYQVPIEDRYLDDESVTELDRKEYSLSLA